MEKPEEGYYRVCIRKAIGDGIRPEARNLEGKVFYFRVGHDIPDDDARYPGEWEMTSDDPLYAQITGGKILWIASGDLKPLGSSSSSSATRKSSTTKNNTQESEE